MLRGDADPVRLRLVPDGSDPGEPGFQPGQRPEDQAPESRPRGFGGASAAVGHRAPAREAGTEPRHGRGEVAVEPLAQGAVRGHPPPLQARGQPARPGALGRGKLRRPGAHPVAVHLEVAARPRGPTQDPEPPADAPGCGAGQVPAPGAEPAPEPAHRHPEVVQRFRVAGAAEPQPRAGHLIHQALRDEPGRLVRRPPEQIRGRSHDDLGRWLVLRISYRRPRPPPAAWKIPARRPIMHP